MKILIILTITLAMATYFKPVNAGELSVSTGQRSMNTADDTYSIGDWNYLKIAYQPDNSNFYYGLSHETAEVSPIYFTHTLDLKGLFVGIKTKPNKNIRIFADIGYYLVEDDFGGRQRKHIEGFYYYLNERFYGADFNKYYYFNEYSLETSGSAFGGTIGVEIIQPINDKWSVSLSASHLILKINEIITGYRDEWTAKNLGWSWQQQTVRDYSSTSFGLSVNYAF